MYYHWNIIGHESELARLEDDLRGNNLSHAYLFIGPEKIGKFRVAQMISRILQCPNNFCHTCPVCLQVEKKCHPDTIEMEDDGESIKIDAIRDLIVRLTMTSQSRYKVVLIQNLGRLTDEASNCLLKTLEEPTERTIFLLTAGQLRDVSPTIASRMRILHFKKLEDDVLREALKKNFPETSTDTLQQAVLLSLGRSGHALELLSEPEKFQELYELYRHIQFLNENATQADRLLKVPELVENPPKMKTFLSLLACYFRQKMLSESSFSVKMKSARIIELIHETLDLLGRNVNTRLLLERIMIAL